MNTPTGKLGQYLTTAFDPRQVPNCALWFDAADSNTITTSGGYVTQWNDKSGNSRNATNVGTGVVSGGTTLNGLNTINFASGSYLLTPSFTMDTITRTAFAVFKFTSNVFPTDGNYYGLDFLIGSTLASGTFQFSILRNPSPFTWAGLFGITAVGTFPQGGTFYTGASGPNNTAFMFTIQRSAAQTGIVSYTGSNSSTTFTNSTAFFATEALIVGRNMSNTQIGEIILYNSAITLSQIQAVEGYLAAKWGLTSSLPATHPYKSLRPISRQFAPVDISGCVLWIDAADASTVTLSGNNITQLQDKSSNAYVFATASGFTYNVTKFNGSYPSFYSPTSTNGYSLGSNTSFTLNQPFTAFAVGGNLIAPSSGGYFWDSTSNANRAALLSFSPGTPTMFAGVELFSTNTTSFTGALILTCQYNTTSSSLFENGVNRSSTSNTGTNNAISLRLGAAWSLTTNWNGHICEILFFNRLMSTAERQQVEGYLADKWGLRGNLASTHPFKLYSALTPVFTPVQISGCTLWLDAADRTTLTLSGSNVTSWIDKSGFRRDASGGVSPTYDSNNQCLVFDGSTTLLQGNANYLHNSNDGTWSVFSVALSTASGTRHIINYDESPKRIAQFLRIESNNTLRSIGFQSDNSTPFIASVGTITLSTKFLGCAVNTTSNITGFFNGTTGSPVSHTANNTLSNTFYEIGVYSGNNAYRIEHWSGNIYEIIVFSNALSTSQRQAVEGYLANKWGLVGSLPASHPYKKFIN